MHHQAVKYIGLQISDLPPYLKIKGLVHIKIKYITANSFFINTISENIFNKSVWEKVNAKLIGFMTFWKKLRIKIIWKFAKIFKADFSSNISVKSLKNLLTKKNCTAAS